MTRGPPVFTNKLTDYGFGRRAVLASRAMRAASGRARWEPAVPALAAAALLLCVLFSGGASERRLAWIGAYAFVAAAAVGAAALSGRLTVPRLTRAGAAFLLALAAFVLWMGLSIVWSVEADRSWDYLNQSFIYLALALLGAAAGGVVGARAPRLAAYALAVALGLAVVWALAGKVVPALDPEGDRVGRVRGTVGYWNAFALLAASAVPLALWLAGARRRMLGALLVYAAVVALLLTFSRGGLAVALACVALWLVLAPGRLESLLTLLAAAVPALAVSVVAFALPGVSSDEQPRDVRVDDGLVFGAALGAGALAVVLLCRGLARRDVEALPDRTRRRLVLGIGGVAVAALAGALVAGALVDTGPLTIHAGPGRLLKLGSSDRWAWWTESTEIFRDRPVGGSGAGTFEVARRPFRDDASDTTEPHSLPLQFLAELGFVGAAVFVVLIGAAIVAVTEAVKRLDGAARALAVVLAGFGLHALVEIDWDYVALTGPAVLLIGLLAAAGHETTRSRARVLPSVAAVALGVTAVLSIAAPRLAQRTLEDARAVRASDPVRAAELAEDAHALNPLSAEILREWALAEELAGDAERARELHEEATELQPENARTWRARGAFELAQGDVDAAGRSLSRARALDPHDPLTQRLLAELAAR
ncbi:MAG: O-antigen ligase family protein [Thermoleophilia bacterium]|nr:O-antigen ligase family protein [Thermoleophilia bacterium]